MKSTYDILSVELDGAPVATNIPIKLWSSDEDFLFPIDANYNVFDYPHCRRVIMATELLSKNINKLSNEIGALKILEELVIKINYCSPLPVNNRLFLKRIYQAISLLQRNHPNIVFVIMEEQGD